MITTSQTASPVKPLTEQKLSEILNGKKTAGLKKLSQTAEARIPQENAESYGLGEFWKSLHEALQYIPTTAKMISAEPDLPEDTLPGFEEIISISMDDMPLSELDEDLGKFKIQVFRSRNIYRLTAQLLKYEIYEESEINIDGIAQIRQSAPQTAIYDIRWHFRG